MPAKRLSEDQIRVLITAYVANDHNVTATFRATGFSRNAVYLYADMWRKGELSSIEGLPVYQAATPSSSLKTTESGTPEWVAAMAEWYRINQMPMPELPGVVIKPERPEPRSSSTAPEIIGSELIDTDGFYRVIVTPDCQLPYEDEVAMSAVERYAADNKFDEWIDLGDYLDLDFLSRYNIGNARANANKKLFEHYHYGREVLDRRLKILRSNNPDAKYTMIEGNHDYRVESFLDTQPALEGLLEVEEGLELKNKGVRWVRFWRDKSLYRVGKALFCHGLYTSKYHAEKMVTHYGQNIFYGHTHDVMEFPKVLHGHGKTIVGQSLGCLCKYDQSYIKGAPSNWQQAFMEIWFFPTGEFTYYVPRIFNGRFIAPNGKLYTGKGAL